MLYHLVSLFMKCQGDLWVTFLSAETFWSTTSDKDQFGEPEDNHVICT